MKTVLIWILRGYRAVISPLYGSVCKYYPTCSAYALEAVEIHGAIRGSGLAVRRLAHCHPWSLGGYDPVPDSERERAWLARLEAEQQTGSGDKAPADGGRS